MFVCLLFSGVYLDAFALIGVRVCFGCVYASATLQVKTLSGDVVAAEQSWGAAAQ